MKNAFFVLLGAVIGTLSTILFWTRYGFLQSPTSPTINYAELTSVLLSVATITLGSVALIVSIAAVYGFKSIQKEATNNAEQKAVTKVEESLPKILDDFLDRYKGQRVLGSAVQEVLGPAFPKEDDEND